MICLFENHDFQLVERYKLTNSTTAMFFEVHRCYCGVWLDKHVRTVKLTEMEHDVI